jgi:hypothetical protein
MSGMESGMGILTLALRSWMMAGLIFSLASCKPDTLGDCFTSTGPIREKTGTLPAFDNLSMEDNMTVIWHDSGSYWYKLRCGRNLMENIRMEVSDQTLSIQNQNRCNWVRSYEKPFEIHLYCPAPQKITLLGFGEFSCADTLNRNPLTVQVYGPGSKGKLLVHTSEFFLDFASAGEIEAEGRAEKGIYAIQKQGKVNAEGMEMERLNLQMFGENDIRIHVRDSLWGSNSARARIYLKGEPKIEPNLKASGNWISIP